ncbi:uncharacterized protein [Agelaius tricolor]|uniref:uncharacterized protein n=1 Tax=Agelaius tricolor TaxID=9191 RepID=UPI0039F1DDB5
MNLTHVMTILTAILLGTLTPPAGPWIVPQPKANVWRTLANALGQEHICLDMGSAEDPMSSCLVGIPLSPNELPSPFNFTLAPLVSGTLSPSVNVQDVWRDGIKGLVPLSSEPPELDLLGSSNAPICFLFHFAPCPWDSRYTWLKPSKTEYEAAQWCQMAVKIPLTSTLGSKPLSLPRGIFFICGDRAWAGIPIRLVRGPCALGQLSLLTPNMTQIRDWKLKRVHPNLTRPKRDLKDLDPHCDSQIEHWSKPKIVAITLFLPWVSVAKSLGELARLECWVVKQANLTSATLSDLLTDEEITRKATLQNRAAIDFLLLLEHHRCEEFEGLCCLNLSSRAEDVRVAIDKMQGLVHEIKQQASDWLGDLFKGWGLSSWAGCILKTILSSLLDLFVVLVACSIVWGQVKRLIARATAIPDVSRVEVPEESGEDWDSASLEHQGSDDICPSSSEMEQAQTSV